MIILVNLLLWENWLSEKRITIKDIAEKAGVSYTTASLVLSGKGKISKETQEKIFKVASELGYISNRRTQEGISLIAFIDGTHYTGGFYMPLIQGVIDRLRDEGYYTNLDIRGDYGPEEFIKRKEVLENIPNNSNGILILSHWSLSIDELLPFLDNKRPFIVLGGSISGFERNFVTAEHYRGAFEVVEYLIKLGHRDIAHISGPKGHQHAELRLKGYIDALNKHNVPIREEYILEGDYHKKSAVEAMKKILNLKPLPSAIFVANDNMALAAMQVAKDNGLKVPEDISFVGFDDIHAAGLADPPLTTVRQPLYEIGRDGAEMLIGLLESGNLFVESRMLRASLVTRKSVIERR